MPITIDEFHHDILELCLDICSPCTLAALWHDHTNYIARHQAETDAERWGDLSLIQQDAEMIHNHLTAEHHKGDSQAAQTFLDNYAHIPF